MKTMDIILLILGVLTAAFTVTMIVLFRRMGAVPDTLVTCWFAAVTGECGAMGWIKTTKDRARERQYQLEDEKRMEENSK